jgi:hypothetical protein
MRIQKSKHRTLGATIVVAFGSVLFAATVSPQQSVEEADSVRSSPKDLRPYARPANSSDLRHGKIHPKVLLRDVVVSNTDPALRNTDTFNDGETSIAVNPANHDEIVITSFAGSWGATAPLWHSTDGGASWTKRFTISRPPGVDATFCPCDQTIDYGRDGVLVGTFLTFLGGTDVYSGATTDPSNAAEWDWLAPTGTTARTNLFASGIADQPWLLVNRDPFAAGLDNVYVAYDDFSTGPDMRVAVSLRADPPDFRTDVRSGISTGFINPGHRLAKNPLTGVVYSLFQRSPRVGAGGSRGIDYMLNRSTDGGQGWPLGGGDGIIVASADSTQPQPKFGTVNALLGGVLHAAVHPQTGDLYYVYGNRDPSTGNNRLAIRRITTGRDDNLVIGAESFVTGQVQAALPSVAVTPNGTVGVFYYTFDGFSADGFPIFTTHVALSTDRGATFTGTPLLTFVSSARDNLDPRQRVFGDYMQMKAAGGTFYGAFTANGVSFGRPFANHDPIFFRIHPTGPR